MPSCCASARAAQHRARYRATIAKQKSLKLKLVRRMLVSSTRVHGRFRITVPGPPSSQVG